MMAYRRKRCENHRRHCDNSIEYLLGQPRPAPTLQIFDTWAGATAARIPALVGRADRRIVAGVRKKCPMQIIGFPRGAGALRHYRGHRVDAGQHRWAANRVITKVRPRRGAGQSRSAGPDRRRRALDRAVDDVLANQGGGRLIFNLGHGINRKPRSLSSRWRSGCGRTGVIRRLSKTRARDDIRHLSSSSPDARPSSRGRLAGPVRDLDEFSTPAPAPRR